ncbi:phytanoyl-CoA dioxygenase family protein [Streptomyces violaceus]|uniref:Phytanoyl-CoA dioxygenase family protein n=1 Tax=Streptomyces violaceus TaxID=1936 RepID=A0ABZ1P258_STRVL
MSTPLPPVAPDAGTIDTFERNGYAVVRDAITPDLRDRLLTAAEKLLASDITQGRDRGGDGKDGFRGCLNLDPAFLPLLANPAVLPTVVQLLSPNIHLLSAHLIALPSGPPSTIRIPGRHGWHRDMYGVTADLGFPHTPRMAIKAAHYLTPVTLDRGLTMFLPGSHRLTDEPVVPAGAIDPPRRRHPRHHRNRRSSLREPDLAHRRHQPLRPAPHRLRTAEIVGPELQGGEAGPAADGGLLRDPTAGPGPSGRAGLVERRNRGPIGPQVTEQAGRPVIRSQNRSRDSRMVRQALDPGATGP